MKTSKRSKTSYKPIIRNQIDQLTLKELHHQNYAINVSLVVALCVGVGFGLAFHFIVHNTTLALLHAVLLTIVLINYACWHYYKNYRATINVILASGLVLVVALVATGGWDNTGLFWPFAYLPFAAFLAKPKDAKLWDLAAFLLTLAAIIVGPYQAYAVVTTLNYAASLFLMLISLRLFHRRQQFSTQQLEESGRLLEKAQDIAKLGSWSWDSSGGEVSCSPELLRILGLPDDKLLNYTTYISAVYPEDRQSVKVAMDRTLKDGRPFSVDHRITKKNGGIAWIHSEGTIDTDTPRRLYGTAHDITEQVLNTAELGRRNRQLEDTKKSVLNILDDLNLEKAAEQAAKIKDEALINSIGDGLIVTDEYGHISLINPIAEKMLGMTNDEVKGSWYQELIEIYNDKDKLLPPKRRPMYLAITTGKNVYRRDLFLAGKGRTRIPVAVTASPYLVDNRPQGVIELFTDISNEKALDQAKDDFLALVSHQLQTPATAVKQFLGLLLEGYIGKIVQEQKDVVQKAYNNNEEQISIIQDLLEVARIESGKSVINVENIDIKAMIDEIVSAQQITVDKRQQHITIVVPAKLTAQADPTKLKMCIANLLSNALKYTSVKGTIQIKAYETESTVSIAIKDNGIGIAKDQMGKLFNRFSRIDQGGASAIPGTGIGLFLCKQIAEMHKGSMIVTSKPGEGSEFTVQLPKMHKKLKAEKS